MKFCFILIYVYVTLETASQDIAIPTIPIKERIKRLKKIIRHRISKHGPKIRENTRAITNFDYLPLSGDIKPIVEGDPLNKYYAKGLRPLVTDPPNTDYTEVTTPVTTANTTMDLYLRTNRKTEDLSLLVAAKYTKNDWKRNLIYRRLNIDIIRKTPYPWVHCHTLILPFFDGVYGPEDVFLKRFSVFSHPVIRLLQLLNVDTSVYEGEDLYALMYQFSKLNIRLFQWDVPSITTLLNVITPNVKTHTLQSVKSGLKHLFAKWLVDLSNTTTFIKKSKIFRPPCLIPESMLGSTSAFPKTRTPSPATFSKRPCHSRRPGDPREDRAQNNEDCDPGY